MAKLIEAGVYDASIVGCYAGVSGQKETPFYAIEFFTDEGTIDFVQYLTDNTKERALNTLMDVGFMGKKVSDLANADLAIGELFDSEVEGINITIEHEPVCDSDGNEKFDDNGEPIMRHRVAWVNVGKAGLIKKDHKEVVQIFKGLSLDGDLMKMRKQRGVTPKKSAPKKEEDTTDAPDTSGEFDGDDIPF